MRPFLRTLARSGRDREVWPVVLVLFAVLVPAVCLLWFMREAMRNERLAAREKLADAYRGQLSSARSQLERAWSERIAALEHLGGTGPPAAAFARCIRSGLVDSVIVLDARGKAVYPNTPAGSEAEAGESGPDWDKARQLEYLRRDFPAAARAYDRLAEGATNSNLAARAWQAQARCLLHAGEKAAVIELVLRAFAGQGLGQAVDRQGRLVAGNAELFALELIADPASTVFQSAARRLEQRLTDYENPVLAASQRRFLMKELRALSSAVQFPTLAAEELAGQFLENHAVLARDTLLQPTSFADLWQFSTANRRILGLVHSNTLLGSLRTMAGLEHLPSDAAFTCLPPGTDDSSALVALPAGPQFPGWRLALSFIGPSDGLAATESRNAVYLWTGILVLGAMGVLGLLTVRLVRRQTELARLKSDLAATVSHELNTPLAAIRVLVDTLLDAERLEEQRVREYLKLIAQEDDRLSRLISNFLAFSRIDQKKQPFRFAPAPARQIAEAAAAAVYERFNSPDCCFEVRIEADLPDILVDPDALITALLNLLDNAWKYSEHSKRILLCAFQQNGYVVFSVRDNGIGIGPREKKRIFQRFYQVDQCLSRRAGGCGLGLSIVHAIVTAHQGSISVESKPGKGSTFAISMPTVPQSPQLEGERVA